MAGIGGEDQHHILQVDLIVGVVVTDAACVQDLQELVDDADVGLLHLVEQHHRLGVLLHKAGEITGLAVSVYLVATGKLDGGFLVAVFAHVKAHEGPIQQLGGTLRQIGLAHTGRAGKEKGSHGLAGIFTQHCPQLGLEHSCCHGVDGVILSQHLLEQRIAHLGRFLGQQTDLIHLAGFRIFLLYLFQLGDQLVKLAISVAFCRRFAAVLRQLGILFIALNVGIGEIQHLLQQSFRRQHLVHRLPLGHPHLATHIQLIGHGIGAFAQILHHHLHSRLSHQPVLLQKGKTRLQRLAVIELCIVFRQTAADQQDQKPFCSKRRIRFCVDGLCLLDHKFHQLAVFFVKHFLSLSFSYRLVFVCPERALSNSVV